MPPIRSVDCADDNLTVVSHKGTVNLNRSHFSAALLASGPIACEERARQWVEEHGGELELFGCYWDIHIFQTEPTLVWTTIFSNNPIDPNWDADL